MKKIIKKYINQFIINGFIARLKNVTLKGGLSGWMTLKFLNILELFFP